MISNFRYLKKKQVQSVFPENLVYTSKSKEPVKTALWSYTLTNKGMSTEKNKSYN